MQSLWECHKNKGTHFAIEIGKPNKMDKDLSDIFSPGDYEQYHGCVRLMEGYAKKVGYTGALLGTLGLTTLNQLKQLAK